MSRPAAALSAQPRRQNPRSDARVLLLLSAAVDGDLRADVEADRRPCPEYLLLESRHSVELLDWNTLGLGAGRSAWRSLRQVAAGLRRLGGCDLVFSDGEHLGIPMALALTAMRISKPHLVIGHRLTTWGKSAAIRWLRADRGMARVLVHSRHQAELAVRKLGLAPEQVRVLPYHVDVKFWRRLPVPEQEVILAPGRENRDHLTLARACAGLQAAVFVTGASVHSPRARASYPRTWPENFHRQRFDYAGLRDLYARAKVVAVPLLPSDYSAGVTTLLEAMAMGKAVVVSDMPGLRDLTRHGHNCILVPARDPHALRQALERLLAQPEERRRLGDQALEDSRRYGLDAYVERLADSFRELAAPPAIGVAGAEKTDGATTAPEMPGRRAPGRRGGRRILVVAPALPYPPHWGFGTRVYQIVRHLARRHSVTLAVYPRPGDGAAIEHLAELCEAIHVVDSPPPASGGKRRAQVASLASRVSYQARSLATPGMQDLISSLLEERRYDLVQVESSQLSHFRFCAGPALVLDEHNIEYELLYRMFQTERSLTRRAFNWVEYRKYRREERAAWERFDACVTTSDRERRIVLAHSARPVVTIPNGVDLDYFRPRPGPLRGTDILFTGRIDYRPNADAVAHFAGEILPRVRARVPEARFVVAGEHMDRPDILRMGRLDVVVTGWVPDMRPYLASARVVVAPLRMGSGTRLKVLDALAMGRPLVSTALGCEGLAVSSGEHLLVADDADAFAEAVVRLLQDPGLSARLGRNGRLLVERSYGWETLVDRLDAFHDELASSGVRSG